MRFLTILAMFLLSMAPFSPAEAGHQNIAEIAIEISSLDGPDDNPRDFDLILAAVLADSVLTDALLGQGEFEGFHLTLFLPRDKAFLKLTETDNEADAAAALAPLFGSEALRNIVLYHVIPDKTLKAKRIFFRKYQQPKVFRMANGDELFVEFLRLFDQSANRVAPVWRQTDIKASNGIIHVIREVLTPKD